MRQGHVRRQGIGRRDRHPFKGRLSRLSYGLSGDGPAPGPIPHPPVTARQLQPAPLKARAHASVTTSTQPSVATDTPHPAANQLPQDLLAHRAAFTELLASPAAHTCLGGPRPRDELEREMHVVPERWSGRFVVGRQVTTSEM